MNFSLYCPLFIVFLFFYIFTYTFSLFSLFHFLLFSLSTCSIAFIFLLYFLALIPAFIISDFHVSIITLKYLLLPIRFLFIIYLRNFLLSRSFNIARCILPLFIVICLPQFIDYISGAFLCKPLILSSISDESSYLLKRRLVCTLSYRTGGFFGVNEMAIISVLFLSKFRLLRGYPLFWFFFCIATTSIFICSSVAAIFIPLLIYLLFLFYKFFSIRFSFRISKSFVSTSFFASMLFVFRYLNFFSKHIVF